MKGFGNATRQWFQQAFQAPTPVQRQGWEAIRGGEHALLIAPTGSGKTLAAFLWAIDRLTRIDAGAEAGVRVLYVSPLKALVYDIERNLRTPLAGIARTAEALGLELRMPTVDMRTGDTPQRDRRRQARTPAEILVTTPESLFLILGSAARETLRTVETVIVDEVHTMAATKRGAHLALSLERLSHLAASDPQRIGLSATARPLDEVARFLGGDRPVRIVDAQTPPRLDLEIVVPVDDMTRPVAPGTEGPAAADGDRRMDGARMAAEDDQVTRQYGIWPAVYPRLLELIRAHTSTIVFVNSRGLCERLAQHLNEEAGEDLVRAHHGSLARVQRIEIEERLKSGDLRGIVATSSLELGIDMGAVDLVVLVESPGSVSRGLQRVGRAGHGVGQVSVGRVFPKHRGDLAEAAVVARLMRDGAIEALRVPGNPLDVLAQHVVAMCAVQPWPVDELARLVRRSANFRDLPEAGLTSVLDMLSGLYPSSEFADLRPRVRWDRERDVLEGRKGSRMLAAVNAGTIPDRGLYGVHLGVDGPRVGELDEEMVHESQAGQTFMLGATTWRIQEITRDRVIVEPAPGEPGRLPFWKGDGPGRPLELGRALGRFLRETTPLDENQALARLTGEFDLDERAARNLRAYLVEQREAAGVVPTDRDVVIERFRDELGDWRVCILTPFGARVHAPWALALRAAVSARVGYDVQTVWSDDGIVLTLADGDDPPGAEVLVPDPDDIEDRILTELARSPLFASQFRENAARALLLPRRRPGARTPLFAQRLRAQKLMGIAMQYPAFPVVMETYRACLQDVFDVPALGEVLRGVRSREIRIHEVETPSASPFARSLVFAYVAAYLYEGDSPAAERRAQALSLDMKLLRELLGEARLRDLLDLGVLSEVEDRLQGRHPDRLARDADELHDLLRRVGDLTTEELAERAEGDVRAWLAGLGRGRQVAEIRVAGRTAWIALEDAGLYRDALGVVPPPGTPAAFLEPVTDPVRQLVLRWARTHGPFTTGDLATRYGMVPAQAEVLLSGLSGDGRLLGGAFRPDGDGHEWCDPEVLRQVKRRTLAKLRGEVAPVPREVLGRFLPEWHGIGSARRPGARLEDAIVQLEGIPLSYRELERSILPARVPRFRPQDLDELGASGWLVWVGHAPIRSDDGRVVLCRRERVGRLVDVADAAPRDDFDARHLALLERLEQRGASFFGELAATLAGRTSQEVMDALWDLVWARLVTNDTFQALRGLSARKLLVRKRRPGRGPLLGGRWSLVRELGVDETTPTERAHARATSLLDRHGIVSREAAAVEGMGGGFSGVYRVLRTMEETGKVRRGYFVEGLGGAQFAYPGTVDRLRGMRERKPEEEAVVISAVDPANPFGWLLPWPPYRDEAGHGPRRVAGAYVVLLDGRPVLYLDRGCRRVRTLCDSDERTLRIALRALPELARRRPRRSILVELVDGERARDAALAPLLVEAGFTREYRGLHLHVL